MRKRVIAMIFVVALLVTATASGQWVKGFKKSGGSKSHQAQ